MIDCSGLCLRSGVVLARAGVMNGEGSAPRGLACLSGVTADVACSATGATESLR